jgi:hypothetical protein
MTALDLERRHIARPVEFRAGTDGPGTLFGYASVYSRYSQNLGGFVEQVATGAFAKSIGDKAPVVARYNHDDNYLLGTIEALTLRLLDDETGLGYEVDLPDTTAGRDVSVLSKRGDLRYSSFAFHTLEDEWGVTEQGFPLRTLLNVRLVDVAPVNSPAYLDSSAGMRSLASKLDIEVDTVAHATTEELRSLLLGKPIDLPAVEARSEEESVEIEQGDTHSLAELYKRKLALKENFTR